jgi:Xaa-Pro aminopeptidase
MVICIEAAKHVPEIGGFQVEDTLIVTERGHEVIDTLMPKTLRLDIS